MQRRHQKVVEYAPADSISNGVREKIFADAVRLAKHVTVLTNLLTPQEQTAQVGVLKK